MTTERIDHAARARLYIERAGTARVLEVEAPKVLASLAQAEATLALVEQQRITNLIELGEQWEDKGYSALDCMSQVLRPEIAVALGLEGA